MQYPEPITIEKYALRKAITYRLISLSTTMTITWIVTGNWLAVLSIGPIDQGLHFLIYLYHEKMWNRYVKGKNEDMLREIDREVYGFHECEDDE